MGSPRMAPMAGVNLTWDERLDIRKFALECACKITPEARQQPSDIAYLLEVAIQFENYLKGN